MFERYIPRNLCREYAEFNFPHPTSFIAVVKGIKPLMSIFVRYDKYKKLERICKKYGLFITHNKYFLETPTASYLRRAKRNSDQSVIKYLTGHTTTKSIAFPTNNPQKTRTVQVFISKSKRLVKDALKFGWTTTVIDKYFVPFDLINMLNFGELLGYPDCCVKFFCTKLMDTEVGARKPYIIYKNTKGKPSFYCNNNLHLLAHLSRYSLIWHFPCSFDCRKTIRNSKKLLDVIREEEPEYAEKIEYYLKLPLLVFRDRRVMAFEGSMKGRKITYSDCIFGGLTQPIDETKIYKFRWFKEGDMVEVTKNEILIFKEGKLLHSIRREDESFGFPLKFY